ncbi:MAG TPA: NAD(P)-dependent oxidoreductase [Verrucomicrobiae bacterium]|nr:NAD(P)-dependent oxidoreductase [Verrucomicrobiae bacterium]
MRILVTGGAGYIGSTLVPRLLSAGHHVRVLDVLTHGGHSLLGVWSHPHFEFFLGDLRDPLAVAKAVAGADAVVHLAAIVGDPACARHPDVARATNLDASLALLEKCKRSAVTRLIFASTCSNYGKMLDANQYVDESSELRPVSLYAETKVAVEKAILDPAKTGPLCATALRFATIYGVAPRMRFDLTVNEFTMEMMTKKRLTVFGEQFWRPYVHVRDAARAIQMVLEQPADKMRNAVFNVGDTEENFRKIDLVELIKPYAKDAVVEYVKKQEDPRDYRVSFAKIRKALGFELSRKVQDGVHEVAQLICDQVVQDFDNPQYRN